MYNFYKSPKIILFVLIILLAISQETEARRKILRGRKTITRWYMRGSAVPAWVVVILLAIGEVAIGGLMYVIMKICILDKPISPRYQLTATQP